MKKFLILAIMVLALLVPTMAIADSGGGDGGQSAVGTLILDNKDGTTWQRIADGKYGVFTYNSSGNTLDWTLAVAGLGATPTNYSLIYFADPYPGNNPGARIWHGDSTSAGRIDVPLTNTDLGMDLPTAPDSNMLVSHASAPDLYTTPLGAKIWLIPSAYYDATLKKVLVWNSTVVSSILFETNLVLYTDTNKLAPAGTPLVTTVTMPVATIGLGVSPTTLINFGSVAINECSSTQPITLTNLGNVKIKVTAVPSAGFYANSLKFGDTLATVWSVVIPVGTVPVVLNAKICPLPGLTGTLTGSVAFIAAFEP